MTLRARWCLQKTHIMSHLKAQTAGRWHNPAHSLQQQQQQQLQLLQGIA
jgi:hypothetical protein